MKPLKCYSTDGEHYEDICSVMATLESEHEPGTKITIYEGVPVEVAHAEFIHPKSIIDSIIESAGDDMGEFAEDYLENLQKDAGAMSDLESLINDWLNKTVGPVNFLRVNKTRELEVTVGE